MYYSFTQVKHTSVYMCAFELISCNVK